MVRTVRAVVVLTGIVLFAAACSPDGETVVEAGAATGRPAGSAAARLLATSHPRPADLPAGSPANYQPAERPVLLGGETGEVVRRLQRQLNLVGISVPEDATFDPDTARGVRQFQTGQGLPADGVVGASTWAALDAPRPTTTTTAPPTTAPPTTAAGAASTSVAPPSGLSGIPQPAPGPLARAVVHLSSQQVELFDAAGVLRFRFPVSSGANGATPPGSFRVFRRVPRATSDSDDTVWMPWLVNFNQGIGFHGIPVKGDVPLWTPLGQRPVSHGCIRMANDAAKLVFDNLQTGATVDVVS